MNAIESKAKIFKALAHPSRIYIVEELIKGERCICEFADFLHVDKSTVSKHFAILKEAGIINTEKQGTSVICSLRMSCIKNFFRCAEELCK